jgi:hypothetical protein
VSDVNANIGIHFDTSDALAQLRRLQAGLSRFNQALTEGNVAAANAQKGLNSQLMQSINATGKFVASQKTIASSTTAFTDSLEKNKLSMGQYFRYTAAAATMNSKTLKGLFAQEKDVLKRAMKDRVKTLQTQYVQLTNANGEFVKVLQVVPKHLKMVNGQYADYATRTQMAAQRQQFLNQLLKQGSTQLLNFGKNTQWAGRQLMVGLTIPLTILGSTAAKVFREMEQATIKFTRVYGDLTTSMGDTDKAVAEIQLLAKEFTKFGIAAKDTMEMAASAAAMGLQGADLQAQVTQATRLSVLGQVEQQQALETTISLQNAFGISADQLAGKINYLNAVENQTVLSIEDLTIAIPKAGPVVKQLGGSVEDLAFFMTAMKEGGINASEGANALKSGLASMINPSKKASEFLAGLGINIKGIVNANAGDLKSTVVGFARALDELDPLNRARAIEQMFGKFQFARLSTLFQNVTKDSSQAARALGLAGATVEELAILSERELGKVEDAVGVKFQKQLENVKLQLIPIGKAFLEAITPVVQFAAKMLEKFNNLSDGTKKFVVGFVGVIGGIAPVVLMTVGLVANGVANLIKFFAMLRSGVAKLNGQNNVLGGGFDYLTQAETENLAQTHALHLSHKDLISTFNVEKTSVDALAAAYLNAASQARALASGSPALFNTVPGPKGAVSGLPKFADGKVPGNESAGDSILALVAPGETIVPTAQSKKYGPLLKAIMGDDLPGFIKGRRSLTADQDSFVQQTSRITPSQPGVADEMAKQLEFINKASAENLLAYAKATGRTVTDASSASLEEIRRSLVASVKDIFATVATAAREKGKTLTVAAVKAATKKEGTAGPDSSVHEFYNPRAKQQLGRQFSHGETSDSVPIDQLSKTVTITHEKTQSDLLNIQRAIDASNAKNGTNVPMPTASPVSGFGYALQGQVNKAMADGAPEIQNFKGIKGNTVATVDAFLEDFQDSGVTKWADTVRIGGGNFERLSGAIKDYDDRLLGAVREWKQNNPGKTFTDADFQSIEQTVRTQVAGIDTELGQVLAKAREVVTGVRLHMTKEQRDIANADAVSRGEKNSDGVAYSAKNPKYDEGRSTYQAGGTEKRTADGLGRFSETVSDDLTEAERISETQSPSKRTERLGVNIGEGLRIGLERKTKEVKSQADQLAEAAIPKVDTANQAKYDAMKNDPEQRQIQKSIDRHYRDKFGSKKVPVPTASESTDTSLTVDVNPKALMSDMSAVQAARQKAKQLEKEASDAEAAAAKVRTEAAKWEEVAAREGGKNMHTAENARDLKKLADEAEIRAAEARIKAAEAARAAAELESGNGSAEQIIQDPAKTSAKVKKERKVIAQGTQEQGDGLRRIVEGTEDTADSTVLVADQTDKIATVTGDIVPAQTENLDSVITTASLNDAIVGTTGDLHGSTIDTAMSQEEIVAQQEREKFLREQMNGELAKQNAALAAGSDLSQTGKKRYTEQQALAEAYGDGTAENPGYTMDKDGHLLFDPELDEKGKKQPTTMTEKQIKKKKRGMRREKVGKYSGKATGVLGMATMAAGTMGAPPQVTAALGTAATVAQFAPMLAGMGPVGWAAAGIMAVGAGAYMLNQHFNKMAAEAGKFAIQTSATRDSMKKMGEMTGKVGASQIMERRRRGSQYKKYNEDYRTPDPFGKKYMSDKEGKDLKKTFNKNVKDFGESKAVDDLSLKLANSIADGVIDKKQADSIAQALAMSIGKQSVALQVIGQMNTILGPEGEDLKKDPVKARLMLLANANNRNVKLRASAESKDTSWTQRRKDVAAIAAYNINNLELATMLADQVALEYETQKKKLEVEIASTKNLEKKLELQGKLKTLVDKEKVDTKVMNNAILNQIITAQADWERNQSNSVWGAQADKEDAFFDSSKAVVENAYVGTPQAESAKTFLEKSRGLGKLGHYDDNDNWISNGLESNFEAQRLQTTMELLVGGKVLSPDEGIAMMDLFAGKLGQLDQVVRLSIQEHGQGKMKELFNMFSDFTNKDLGSTLVQYIVLNKKDPAEFDAMMESLANIKSLDGVTIDMELLLAGGAPFLEELRKRQEAVEAIKEAMKTKDEADKKSGKKEPKTKEEKEAKQKEDANFLLEQAKSDAIASSPAIKALQNDADRMAIFQQMSRERQIEYVQDLVVTYASQNQISDEQLKIQREIWVNTQMSMGDDTRLLVAGSLAYTAARDALIAKYNGLGRGGQANALLTPYLDPSIDPKTGLPVVDPGPKAERDTTYDELNKRLRNVRNSAIDAAGGFKELQRAIAATGSKAIGDKFKGLEQQLIKMGQTSQFTDYLAGLDTKDLKKFAYTATAADVKKKKGKQKYTQVDPETGKMVTKYQKFKAGDTVLTQKGRDMEQGYKKAIIGDYNKAQLQSLTLAKQEIAARGKLLALGFDELDIQTMLADENYKTLIATGKVTKAELETNAALTKQARIRNQINGAVAGQKDLQKTTDNQKRIPEVVAMMQQAGMSTEAIRAAITDPAMLDTLINGMDNFATLAKDAQDEFNHLLSQINEIPERKIIELVFTQTREEKIINAANAAAEMFDAYKMIDENTLTNSQGNTFAGLQVMMEDLNSQSKIAQNAINLTQSKIDDMQKEVDADQRKIEENFTRPIEKKQRDIEKLTRSAELNFTRPIQALQERSAVLSHDLDVMNKAAEAINEKYDKQQEALTKVSEINQQIISQQQQQLGLADALSQGDISGAAKAIQDMRASNAANYATSAQDALQKARENEVGSLRGGVSGKSQKEIEAEQWDISQKTYDLELKKAAVDKEILEIQDSIYTLEQSRQVALDAIQVKTDAIAKITFGTLLDQQNKLKAINDQLLPLQSQSDLLAAQITANDRNRIIQGQTRAEWDLTLKAAQAAEKLAKGDLALALAGVNSVSGTIKGAWDSIKSSYDAIKDKSITITQHIVTTYGAALGLPDPNAGKTDPNAGKNDPAKSPGSAWIWNGSSWIKPTKPVGDYGWDDNKGWVKGYAGDDAALALKAAADKKAADEATAIALAKLTATVGVVPTKLAAGESGAIGAASIAAQLKAAAEAKAIQDNINAMSRFKAKELADARADQLAAYYKGRTGGLSRGGLVPKYFAAGGYARGTDTVPAMLTPGEFVMSRYAVNSHGTDKMKAINSGSSVGDSVYNYNLSVNVKSDASPDQIARTVIAQIQQIDSQRMRGTRI